MTAKTFSQLLIDLDILASYSRPRTSDDNPYSESHFKTVKYAPTYPGCFADPQEARSYFQSFFPWYNTHHHHSGIGLLTPDAVHYGRANEIQAARQRVLNDVYTQHPERFVNGPPRPPQVPGESVDQSTAEHYRMRTNSSVNFHARCLIRLDTVRCCSGDWPPCVGSILSEAHWNVVHGFGVPHAHLMVVPQHSSDDIVSARYACLIDGRIEFREDSVPTRTREELDAIVAQIFVDPIEGA